MIMRRVHNCVYCVCKCATCKVCAAATQHNAQTTTLAVSLTVPCRTNVNLCVLMYCTCLDLTCLLSASQIIIINNIEHQFQTRSSDTFYDTKLLSFGYDSIHPQHCNVIKLTFTYKLQIHTLHWAVRRFLVGLFQLVGPVSSCDYSLFILCLR